MKKVNEICEPDFFEEKLDELTQNEILSEHQKFELIFLCFYFDNNISNGVECWGMWFDMLEMLLEENNMIYIWKNI